MKSADNGTDVFLDDVIVNGRAESFDADPKWDGKNNRETYTTQNVRPHFDFGFSATNFAGCVFALGIFFGESAARFFSVSIAAEALPL